MVSDEKSEMATSYLDGCRRGHKSDRQPRTRQRQQPSLWTTTKVSITKAAMSNNNRPPQLQQQYDDDDDTPAQEWLQSVNATCNRLHTQYVQLLKSASSVTALSDHNQNDPRIGGGIMTHTQDPPPPPLAADVEISSLQCQLATENLAVGTAHILSLIRTLRLSILLMDHETIAAEEEYQVSNIQNMTQEALEAAVQLEEDLLAARNSQWK